MNRRQLLINLGLAAAALPAASALRAAPASRPLSTTGKTFVLVHGSWHFSGQWALIKPYLAARGHRALALDLPGHRLDAAFPSSYFLSRKTLDFASSFATEKSPVAHITLDDYVSAIDATVKEAMAGGSGPVVLVRHSMGGLPITPYAERHPDAATRLVYLTAFMPDSGMPGGAYVSPETSSLATLMKADPAGISAFRMDHNSTDPAYVAAMKHAFYNDVPTARFVAVSNAATPDDPLLPFVTPIQKPLAGWGRVPRTFIRCTQDNALFPVLQPDGVRCGTGGRGSRARFQRLAVRPPDLHG